MGTLGGESSGQTLDWYHFSSSFSFFPLLNFLWSRAEGGKHLASVSGATQTTYNRLSPRYPQLSQLWQVPGGRQCAGTTARERSQPRAPGTAVWLSDRF